MTRRIARLTVLALLLSAGAATAADYVTPEAAVAALEAALKTDNVAALHDVFGPGSDKLLISGDAVADREARRRFLESFETAHRLDAPSAERRVLVVGRDEWPLPISLVQSGGRWHFDSIAGTQEIIDRQIGQNEIEAIRTLLAVADAQKDYFDRQKAATGKGAYARRFIASAEQRDGLYWPARANEAPSPLAPLAEIAEKEGYSLRPLQAGQTPFQGYRFRMLTGQGLSAPGGARSYLTGNRLAEGYAVLAWPARYGISGVTSFQMGPDGVVYQKDLGPQTSDVAARITQFDPDLSWTRVDITD